MKEYAVYKGEEILAIGTAREIAEKLNVQEKTVHWWCSKACRRRGKANYKLAIKIEED